MKFGGENLREYISHVVAGSDELEGHNLVGDLLAQPRHFDAEVPVASADDVVPYHRDARLIVLEEARGFRLREAKLVEQVA